MANANIRHEVFCCTRYNIQRILGSPKLYLILIILSCYILQLVFCPRTLDGPIQYLSIHKTNLTVLEPYILIVNGYYPLQFIMIGFILLISDAPFLEAGIGNYLIRSKRSRWFLGQIAYILFLSVIYNIFLLLITTLPFIPYLRLSTNWSPLIQKPCRRIMCLRNLKHRRFLLIINAKCIFISGRKCIAFWKMYQ